jgi:hypothetical protein
MRMNGTCQVGHGTADRDGVRAGREGQGTKLLEGGGVFVGIDVHKSTFSVAVWTDGRSLIATWSQPSDCALLIRKPAEYACTNLLTAVCVPTVEEEADRQVWRTRESVQKKVKRAKRQIKSFLLTHGTS